MQRPAFALLAALTACGGGGRAGGGSAGPPPPAPPAPPPKVDVDAIVRELVGRHGEAERARIERGVRQVAALWRAEDGDLAAFARQQFVPSGAPLDAGFARF